MSHLTFFEGTITVNSQNLDNLRKLSELLLSNYHQIRINVDSANVQGTQVTASLSGEDTAPFEYTLSSWGEPYFKVSKIKELFPDYTTTKSDDQYDTVCEFFKDFKFDVDIIQTSENDEWVSRVKGNAKFTANKVTSKITITEPAEMTAECYNDFMGEVLYVDATEYGFSILREHMFILDDIADEIDLGVYEMSKAELRHILSSYTDEELDNMDEEELENLNIDKDFFSHISYLIND